MEKGNLFIMMAEYIKENGEKIKSKNYFKDIKKKK
jgi:hypothetical protein